MELPNTGGEKRYNLGRGKKAAEILAKGIKSLGTGVEALSSMDIPITDVRDSLRPIAKRALDVFGPEGKYVKQSTPELKEMVAWMKRQADPDGTGWTAKWLPGIYKSQGERLSHGQFGVAKRVMEYQKTQNFKPINMNQARSDQGDLSFGWGVEADDQVRADAAMRDMSDEEVAAKVAQEYAAGAMLYGHQSTWDESKKEMYEHVVPYGNLNEIGTLPLSEDGTRIRGLASVPYYATIEDAEIALLREEIDALYGPDVAA